VLSEKSVIGHRSFVNLGFRFWEKGGKRILSKNDRGNKYIQQIKQIVLDFLKDQPVKIVLYGSRARGDNDPGSDVDIGILSEKEFNGIILSKLRDLLEESTIPYKVEIVDLRQVSETFKAEILKDAVIWKD
jgi:predicted nucleotidyltransferase